LSKDRKEQVMKARVATISAMAMTVVGLAAGAGGAAPTTEEPQRNVTVQAGVPTTAEEHLARAESYRKKAAEYRAEADAHRKMFADYQGKTAAPRGRPNVRGPPRTAPFTARRGGR
jgi:hypothetical protein